MANKESEFRVEQVEALVRGLPADVLEKALQATLASLMGVPREALANALAGNESSGLTRAPTLDAALLRTLPDETLEALSRVLLDTAADVAGEGAPAAAPTAVNGDATAAFNGEVWKPEDAAANSFRAFYELNGNLSREQFLAAHKEPFLVSSVSFDRATWSGAVVFPVVKKAGAAGPITVGRDPACDLVIPHTSVSKHHVTLEQRDGKWFVQDAGSSNGTKIDDVTIEPEKPVRLREISKVELGGGARLTFNAPSGLFHFLEQIRRVEGRVQTKKAEGPGVKAAQMRPSPQAKKTAGSVPVQPAKPASSPKVHAAAPKPAHAAKDEPSRAAEALRGVASLIGTPQRLLATIVMAVLLVVSVARIGPPLAFMLFGESHPEWFEKDLPDVLKNPPTIVIKPAAPRPKKKDEKPAEPSKDAGSSSTSDDKK